MKYGDKVDKLTIIVPIYNEEDCLLPLEEALNSYISKAAYGAQVLLVNDGSRDNSQTLIEDLCRRNRNFHFLQLSPNRGLSTALKAGFDHVQTPLVGYIDADLQTTPEDFALLMPFAEEYAMVLGIRTKRQDDLVKRISSLIANAIRRQATGDNCKDTGCPLKIIQTDYIRRIPFFNGMHRFLPALVMLEKGQIKQVPVRHFPRLAGVSKYHLFNRLLGPLADTFAFVWMRKRYIHYRIVKTDE
jgi:glycosyltransferase involved in cell wall biosynthesis